MSQQCNNEYLKLLLHVYLLRLLFLAFKLKWFQEVPQQPPSSIKTCKECKRE